MPRTLALFVALLLLVPDASAQGKLQRAREETNPSPDTSTDTPSGSSSSRPSDDESGVGDFIGALLFPAACFAVAGPFILPNQLFETFSNDANFPGHPYADVAGYLRPGGGKPWGLRVGVEEGNDFDGLNRVGVRAWLDTGTRFGVATTWDHYVERLPCGCIDEFVVGDLMLTYRFVQSERVQMHAGLGARGLFDRNHARGGFNFSYSADVFPVEPFVLSARAEAGNVNSAFVSRLRATAGVQLRHGEVFLGYDWLRIGGVDLHGPMVGLRLWF